MPPASSISFPTSSNLRKKIEEMVAPSVERVLVYDGDNLVRDTTYTYVDGVLTRSETRENGRVHTRFFGAKEEGDAHHTQSD